MSSDKTANKSFQNINQMCKQVCLDFRKKWQDSVF